jgi:hypothetical protein
VEVDLRTGGFHLSDQQVVGLALFLVLGLNSIASITRTARSVAVLVSDFTHATDLGLHRVETLTQVRVRSLFGFTAVSAHDASSSPTISRLLPARRGLFSREANRLLVALLR